MEKVNLDKLAEAILALKEKQTAATPTGRKSRRSCNEFRFYKPAYEYADPVIVEHKINLSQYGIKGRYIDMTFQKIKALGVPTKDKDSYRYAYKYAVHLENHIREGRGLIMTGPVGTGKTSLAISILRVAIDKGYNGLFVQMVSLLDTMFMLKDVSAEHRLRYERRLKNTPLLVLDDFGAEYGNKWVEHKVGAIISERVADGKSTIITTNLSPDDLKVSYDDRIYDRLKETSFVLKFEGESQREGLDIANI